jgi:hypothetical protein
VAPIESWGSSDGKPTEVLLAIQGDPKVAPETANVVWVPRAGLIRVKLHAAAKTNATLDPFEIWVHLEN